MMEVKPLLKIAKAQSGYGLALLMVFMASTILIGTSFQLISSPVSMATMGRASQTNLLARQVAMAGLATVEADIQTKLNAGQTITTAYRYPASGTANITVPTDPANLTGGTTVAGNYYGTVTLARGNIYMVKITATANGISLEQTKLLQANNATYVAPPPVDTCTLIETTIAAGNIDTLTDAQLIQYAQDGCMIKTASVTMQTPTAGSGSTGSCGMGTTHNAGPATLSFNTLTACDTEVRGTYSTIQLKSTTSSIDHSHLWSYPSSGPRTIQVPGNIGSYSVFKAHRLDGAVSSIPHTFIFNNTNPGSSPEIVGGNGDDNIYINGASTADIWTYNGANNIYINGTWGTSNDGSYISLGHTGLSHTGANNLYVNYITSTVNATIDTFSSGVSQIYFNHLGAGTTTINGGDGADIIGCGVSFTGGAATCGTFANDGQTKSINGNNGADIISIDGRIESSFNLQGGSGSNIIYVKGCNGNIGTASIQPGSNTSLVIIGGNRLTGCYADGPGGAGNKAVIIKKSGITEANATNGYARSLTY